MLRSLCVTRENEALLTDLYELTMAAAYWSNQVTGTATFELYFRRLPSRRSYVIAAGLEQILEYICGLKFSRDQVDWLRRLPQFADVDTGFFDYLSKFHFTGDVWAVAEGTPVFPLEPMIQVHAPLIEAQILETYLLSMVNMQSMIATKAARIVRAAAGKKVVDFGTRRAHGPQAGLLAARASFIGGCIGTSNVLAGYLCDIPIYGTAAHSYMMAFDSEMDAFRSYYRVFPQHTVLLIDTYDTVRAARMVKNLGSEVRAVRIDSGDLLAFSKEVRQILDEDGLTAVKIFVSGDLNEYKIEELLAKGAPIDFFGVGTELVTSYDDPALSGVYKLVEASLDDQPKSRRKTSPGKPSYPGRKQIYRFVQGSHYSHDVLTHMDEKPISGGTPLLRMYVENGKPTEIMPELTEIQENAEMHLERLSPAFHTLSVVEDYPVVFSDRLREMMEH